MRNRLIGPILLLGAITVAGMAAFAWEADFDPSNYNPVPNEVVTFAVCEPCLDGAEFTYGWDFDGDGVFDEETSDAVVSHAFSEPGFYPVKLTLTAAGGRQESRLKGVLVGDVPAYGLRELVRQTDGTLYVLITIHVASPANAIGFEESIPQGWQYEEVDSGGAITHANREKGVWEIVWASSFEAGAELTYSYRLYPTYASRAVPLDGELIGYAEGRFAGAICGELMVPAP